MAFPSGARVWSQAAYWTNRTYGLSGWRPAATSASAAATSSSVPPRWTVAARRGALRGPRHRAVQRPVHLEHARPVAEALREPPGPWRQPVARDRDELARRDVEDDGAGEWQVGERPRPDGRSRPRRRAPRVPRPSRRRRRCAPPRTIGQPTAWAYVPRTRPNEALNGRSRRSIAWAAIPANSAARGVVLEPAAGETARGAERRQAEPRERQRMPRHVDDGLQEFGPELLGVRGRAARTAASRLGRRRHPTRPRSPRPTAPGRPLVHRPADGRPGHRGG